MIKFRSWEYWPFGIIQFPAMVYYAWLSLRARSFLFFSSSNPGIVMGGMFGESKYDVIKKIPAQYIPKTILVTAPTTPDAVRLLLQQHKLSLPLIFKPELGERGFMVKRILHDTDIEHYLSQMRYNFLVQELVDLPLEFGVFYTRFPLNDRGEVTSVVMKEMLAATGDGKTTLRELILQQDRARLQWEKLRITFATRLDEVIAPGERIELVPIGNHCLGTKFLDGSHLINKKLSATFDDISKQIEGFYFGRFDLRCNTLEDLYDGNIKIMELNGCGAEPAHIYQPGYSLMKAIRVLLVHWRNIFLISRTNAAHGSPYITLREARMYYRRFKEATQS
jgi:hypothetical protein